MSDENYKKRMQRKKAHIDNAIEQAQIETGIVILLTGNGKGKSSSALGMVLRALGHDMQVAIYQFIKSWTNTGEQLFLQNDPRVDFNLMGTGFTWDTQNKAADQRAARELWDKALLSLNNPDIKMVVLDELTYMISYNMIDEAEILHAIENRPQDQHVIVTGRAASEGLKNMADTVSDVQDVKHAFRAGIKAMPGLEW